jgi:hypothetical protein
MILENLYGYRFVNNEELRNRMFSSWKENKVQNATDFGISQEEILKMDFSESEYLILTPNAKQYYISKPVMEFSKQIRLKDVNEFRWLLPIKDQTSQYNFDNTFIKFQKKGDRLVAFSSTVEQISKDQNYIHFNFFNINLQDAQLNSDDTEYSKNAQKTLLQLLSFIELSEIEEITIKPNSQHGFGSKKDPNTLFNSQKFPITIVNSRWATKVYRPGEFIVRPQHRWQPKGPRNNPYYELIFIDAFWKQGMTISAKKEKAT